MAHKTLIGGTSYDISGGKALVDGTSYSIKNGKALIGGTAYDISFLLPPAVLDLWSGADARIESIIYANGYWIVGGYYNDGSTCYARIAYATELNGTWTIKDLWSTSSGKGSHIYDITYGDGYFVVLGDYASGSGLKGRIAYATDVTGTWVTNDFWSNSLQPVYCIEYGNGYWVIGGLTLSSNRYYGKIAYNTEITGSYSGSWTSKNLWGNANYSCPVKDIRYANGYWYAVGMNYSSTSPRGMFALSPSVPNSFESKVMLSDSDTASLNKIIYENGYLVTVGKEANEVKLIYWTDATASSSVVKTLWTGGSATALVHKNGYWVVLGTHSDGSGTYYNRIAYATTPDGEWTILDFWSGTDTSYLNVYDIEYGNGFWSVVGSIGTSSKNAHLSYAPNLNSLIW